MRYIFLLLLKLVFINNLFSQVVIVDIGNNPIPFVQVTAENKYFQTQSDLEGVVEIDAFRELKETDTIFFHHVSYQMKYILKKNLSIIDTIVEYLSKTGKNKYTLRKKEHRSFVNTKIEESMAHRSVGITFLPHIPRPPEYYLPFNYIKKHNLILKQGANGNKEIFSQKGELIGKIETTDATITFSINDNHINPTRKALKTEVTIQGKEFILVFRNNGLSDVTAIDKIDDLLYFKSINKILYKHNKDKKHTKVFQVQELFIEDVNYTNTVNTNSYTNRSGMPQFSSYNSNFWNSCNCEAYYLPNEYLFRGLQEK